MSAIIHGAGAGAATALSTFNSKKLVVPCRTNLPGLVFVISIFEFNTTIDLHLVNLRDLSSFVVYAARNKRYIVAGSDASKSFGSGLRVGQSQKLIPNAVAVMRVCLRFCVF